MRAYKITRNGREVGYVKDQGVGEACLRISYCNVNAEFHIYHMRIEVTRPNLPDMVYNFEPIDIIEVPEHL